MANKTRKQKKKEKTHILIQNSGFKYTISQLNAILLGQQVVMHR